ncbi:hypothetical protein CC79DRAFT_195824 [Sarocladium strictum]
MKESGDLQMWDWERKIEIYNWARDFHSIKALAYHDGTPNIFLLAHLDFSTIRIRVPEWRYNPTKGGWSRATALSFPRDLSWTLLDRHDKVMRVQADSQLRFAPGGGYLVGAALVGSTWTPYVFRISITRYEEGGRIPSKLRQTWHPVRDQRLRRARPLDVGAAGHDVQVSIWAATNGQERHAMIWRRGDMEPEHVSSLSLWPSPGPTLPFSCRLAPDASLIACWRGGGQVSLDGYLRQTRSLPSGG